MTTSTSPVDTPDTEPLVFDPFDYAFQDDPYPVYARLRAEAPLFHEPTHDLWVLTRHADLQQAFRSEGVYSSAMGVSLEPSAWGPDAHRVMSFLGMDGARQQRLRSLVSKGFTPRRVVGLQPRIQQLTERYLGACLETAADGGTVDWIRDFAGRLPMDVISEMMGVPEADRDEVRRLADLVVHREDGVHDVPQAGMAASLDLVVYYAAMVEARRRTPTDDLTSALLAVEVDGDRLTDDEIIAFLFLMVVAGNETTTKLLGHALFHLSRHPEQAERVFGAGSGGPARDLVEPWIEETLRYDTSSQLLALGSANRDERVFDRPDVYDIDRPKEELAQLLSFGGGRHFCLGANLARLEARVALRELVRRVERVEVEHDACERVHSVSVRGFRSVPVRLVPRPHPLTGFGEA